MLTLVCILSGGARAVERVNLTSPPRVAAVLWPLAPRECGQALLGVPSPGKQNCSPQRQDGQMLTAAMES